MILTFAEDFSSTVVLDNELTGTPESGLYWNRGVLPFITADNLLTFLPLQEFTFTDWDSTVTYNKFETSKKRIDLVSYDGNIYQSLQDNNLNKQPDIQDSYWLKTNIESLRIKSFIWGVQENLISALSLSRKMVENQFIYNIGENLVSLPNDYSAWSFDAKGSDYVKLRINQIALQANTSNPVNLYVINQGNLVTTLILNPQNGELIFEDIGYTIDGKGKFIFAIDSQDVYSNNAFNDPLKYDGFVCYPMTGVGNNPQDADYSYTSVGNGMNFNITAYMDSSDYVTNNLIDFAKLFQYQFEMDFIQMMLFNANTRTSGEQRILGADKNLLTFQSSDLKENTAARRYMNELERAKRSINKTFDKFLKSPKAFKITRGMI